MCYVCGMKLLWLILLKLDRVIDLENGGAKVMRKESMIISGLNEEGYTFPSPMTLRFQALHAACQFRRKYWIGVGGLLLIIAGIISAFVLVASQDSTTENTIVTTFSPPTTTHAPEPQPAKNYSKKCYTDTGIKTKSFGIIFSKTVGSVWLV